MVTRAKAGRTGRVWTLSLLSVVALFSTAMGESPGDQSLIKAVREQDKAAIASLLEKKVDVNARQADGATALHWAVHRDDHDTTKSLLESGAKVDSKNDLGVTPLSLACTNANAAIIETLVTAGADPNAALMTGETPLMTAARTGDLDSVDVLLRHKADINSKEPIRKQTALMWAIGEKHSGVAQKLVEYGADIHAATTLGFTPLLFAAREGDLQSTRLLLDAGADANTTTKDKLSALHVATVRGHGKVAALLLDRGADANADGPGYTPLHWAVGTWETEMNGANGMTAPKGHEWDRLRGVQEGKVELVKALLKHGADPNARLENPPTRYGFTVQRTARDSTPLTLAAFAGEAEIMQLLADHDADLSLRPKNGLSPLLTAAGVNRFRPENAVPEDNLLAAVKMAVALGADVNEKDRSGNTAMHGAAWIRSTKIIRFLASKGADVNALNKKKQSPIYIAEHDGRSAGSGPKLEKSAIADLLRELGASDVAKASSRRESVEESSPKKTVKAAVQKKTVKPVDASGEQVDPSGTWRWEHDEEGTTVKDVLKLNLEATTKKLTGTYQGSGDPLTIKSGKIDGDKLTVDYVIDADGTAIEVTLAGRIAGNTVSGTAILVINGQRLGEFPWSAERSAVETVDPSGTWRWTHDEEGTTVKNVLKLNLDATTKELAGTYKGRVGPLDIKSGKIDGDKLTVEVVIDIGGGTDLDVNFAGKINGDDVSGLVELSVNGKGGKLPWNAKRSVEASDVVGAWQLAIVRENEEPLTATLSLKQAGEKGKLEAEYTGGDSGRSFDVKDVTVRGDKLLFTINGKVGENSLTARYTIQPRGDRLTGTVEYDLNGATGELAVKGQRTQPAEEQQESQ